MTHKWFKPRGYKHFDAPVGERFANECAAEPEFVRKHSWLPLVHYVKRVKRYKPKECKTVYKDRPIMYASHRDACILSKYAHDLSRCLDVFYEHNGLSGNVIAYRRLGKSSYDFSADAYRFCLMNLPCIVLCFDITGFFDNLDHSILKDRLKTILGVSELADDWYKVFRHVTAFKRVERSDLAAHPVFGPRLKLKTSDPIARISDIVAAGVPIFENENKYGIPQGTPISSALSNTYMINVDIAMSFICRDRNALYQRYSDDILIACRPEDGGEITAQLHSTIESEHKLEIKPEKTERVVFNRDSIMSFQYLGFNVSTNGARIRPSSMSRQWRKLRRNVRRMKRAGMIAVATGKSPKIYTKKLRRQFSPVGARNFSSYARRSAEAFRSKAILRQIRRLERHADDMIRDLRKEPSD